MGALGCGRWTAYTQSRGGGSRRLQIGHTGLSVTKAINDSGSFQVTIPTQASGGAGCCAVFSDTEPWRDEVICYRDDEVGHVGPVTGLSAGSGGGSISGPDLFGWMEARFLSSDFHGDGDVADIFAAVFAAAYDPDTSPNIDISTRHTGIDAVRDYRGLEFQRAADILRELARTGLDFTMDGRRLLAGGLEVLLDPTPLLLHDDGVVSATITQDGSDLGTDVAVFGATLQGGGEPITGRASSAVDRYGLLQRSYTELTIRDTPSADANAQARLESMQPVPYRLTAVLSERAAFSFSDLLPGRRVDVRLSSIGGCVELLTTMRLLSVRVEASESETITIECVPLGVSE